MLPDEILTEEEYNEMDFLVQNLHTYLHVIYDYTEKHMHEAVSLGNIHWMFDRVVEEICQVKSHF